MESRASLSLPCVPYEPGPWPLTPWALDSVISGPRDTVCVGMCWWGGVDQGLIISWPHSPSLHHLTPHLHFTGYKTHILRHRHTPGGVVQLSLCWTPPGQSDLSYFTDMSSSVVHKHTHTHTAIPSHLRLNIICKRILHLCVCAAICHHFGSDWNISTATRWTPETLCDLAQISTVPWGQILMTLVIFVN